MRRRDANGDMLGDSMLGKTAIFVIPTLAVAVTALVLLGPGAARPAIGVRLRGVPLEGGRVLALRLEGLRRFYDVEEGTALRGLEVEGAAGGGKLEGWTGETSPDGIAEVQLKAAAPMRGPLTVRIRREGAVVGEGTIPLRRGGPVFVQIGTIAGTVAAADPAGGGLGPSQGELSIRVDAARGVLAAPFPEVIRVFVADKLDPRLGLRADLEISAPGADLSGDGGFTTAAPLKLSTDEQGAAKLTVKPLAHQVELTVIARATGKSARWEGWLPIAPGATWIDPAGSLEKPPLALVSPSPRERVYLSFWTEEGRVFGAVAPLARDPQGFYRGQVTPSIPPSARLVYVTVAGDPLEQGAGTVAYPLRPAEGAAAPRPLELLLDGVPAAQQREQARAWRARRAGMLVVGAAAVLEMLLLLLRSRASQQKLEAHFMAASREEPEGDRQQLLASAREYPVLRALIAAAVVALAFSIVAALGTFR